MTMTKSEAMRMLSLEAGYSRADVVAAKRALLLAIHPDRHPTAQKAVFERLTRDALEAVEVLLRGITDRSPRCEQSGSRERTRTKAEAGSDGSSTLAKAGARLIQDLIATAEEVVFEGPSPEDSRPVHFSLAVLSVDRFTDSQLDYDALGIDRGNVLVLRVRVTNLMKKKLMAFRARDAYVVTDAEGFEYCALNPDHFAGDELFKGKFGVSRFSDWSDCPQLRPRVPVEGAMAFLVPADSDKQYCLSPATPGPPDSGSNTYVDEWF